MSIIEAIKSGKRFRRKSWTAGNWYETDVGTGGGWISLSLGAIIADDWEVEETRVTVTREQLYRAASTAIRELENDPYSQFTIIDRIARELGL